MCHDLSMEKAWLALAVSGRRQHGGNDGYSDDPESTYVWDSTVPNHAKVNTGDAIVLWDRAQLLGASVIDSIATRTRHKSVYRCPKCKRASIKVRDSKSPIFRCQHCTHEFDAPDERRIQVTEYRSNHARSWTDLLGGIDAPQLRRLCIAPKSQLSLRPLNWEDFSNQISGRGVGTSTPFIDTLLQPILGGHRNITARARIGQGEFRRRLLAEFDSTCAITGTLPTQALEACHLYSYASTGVHHSKGGILLRRDIHRLFDLGLIAINPLAISVDVSTDIRDSPSYGVLHDQSVKVPLSPGHLEWIRMHWEFHRPKQ